MSVPTLAWMSTASWIRSSLRLMMYSQQDFHKTSSTAPSKVNSNEGVIIRYARASVSLFVYMIAAAAPSNNGKTASGKKMCQGRTFRDASVLIFSDSAPVQMQGQIVGILGFKSTCNSCCWSRHTATTGIVAEGNEENKSEVFWLLFYWTFGGQMQMWIVPSVDALLWAVVAFIQYLFGLDKIFSETSLSSKAFSTSRVKWTWLLFCTTWRGCPFELWAQWMIRLCFTFYSVHQCTCMYTHMRHVGRRVPAGSAWPGTTFSLRHVKAKPVGTVCINKFYCLQMQLLPLHSSLKPAK